MDFFRKLGGQPRPFERRVSSNAGKERQYIQIREKVALAAAA